MQGTAEKLFHTEGVSFSAVTDILFFKIVLPLPSKYKILKNDIIRSKLIDLNFLHTGRVQYMLYIFSCIR